MGIALFGKSTETRITGILCAIGEESVETLSIDDLQRKAERGREK